MMTVEVVLAGARPGGNSDELVWMGTGDNTLYRIKKRGNNTSTYSVGRVTPFAGKWEGWSGWDLHNTAAALRFDTADEAKAWVYVDVAMKGFQ